MATEKTTPRKDRAHERLEGLVKERTEALWEALGAMERTAHEFRTSDAQWAERMLRAARFKDDETAAHIQRMSHYCGLLASYVVDDVDRAEAIRVASQLHDIGKIAIPDDILLKVGPLSDYEKLTMQRHTVIGRDILGDESSEMARLASTIVIAHHEYWDGGGYPYGVAGEAIPIEARIAAIADAFDALTTNRIYRRAFSLPDGIRKMKKASEAQFDPVLLDLFLDHMDQVLDIQQRYPDNEAAVERSA